MEYSGKKEVHLKNGRVVCIRKAELSDTENLFETIQSYVGDSQYIPKFRDEITLTVSEQKEWVKSFLEHDNSLLLVAECDQKIIGNIDLTGGKRRVMEHTAVLGMGMLNEWRNCGLGTALMSEVIQWAKQNPLLELVWLELYTENAVGLSLYEKVGFIQSGVVKNFFKQDDRYFDNLRMVLDVK